MLKVMINEFAQRRYKELYDEDIWENAEDDKYDILPSSRWSLDHVDIQQLYICVSDVRVAQQHQIPCKIVRNWTRRNMENDDYINLFVYRKTNEAPAETV
jgi:hypothetical protein